MAYRITVSNNLVHGNARTGIEAGSAVLVTGNSVYGQMNLGAYGISNFTANAEIASNSVHDNDNGISLTALARDNRVYHNTHIGIVTGAGGIIRNNVVYSNAIGIRDYFDGYYNTSQVLNNLIYANSDAGIVVATPYGSGSPIITSNTVYQPAGDAVSESLPLRRMFNCETTFSGLKAATTLVPADSEIGFQSDYNDSLRHRWGQTGSVGRPRFHEPGRLVL